MSDRHYLLRVLGISAIPRFIGFGLKFVTFPLMMRNLGAAQFGVVVYLSAIITVLESFVDFGVSSAAGKEIAVARELNSLPLVTVVKKWARLQAVVIVIGLLPLLGGTYLIASAGSEIKFSFQVLTALVLGTWLTSWLSFVRASLTSMLAFRALGSLDATESFIRSLGWLGVAYVAPTTLGFAVANLLTVVGSSVLGVSMLWILIRRHPSANAPDQPLNSVLRLPHMLRESFTFLWLRLITRIFQAIPIMIMGRMFDSEIVGIVGAFARVAELINFPFLVIGNALAVRAPGVLAKGAASAKALWDTVSRFFAISLMLTISIFLGAKFVAAILLPTSSGSTTFIAILSITVFTSAMSSVIAPMSDYVGGLRSRNILLTIFSFGQIPLIWFGAFFFGAIGAVVAYVTVLVLMNFGYLKIAISVFFPTDKYRLRSEFSYFITITAVALVLTMLAHRAFGFDRFSAPLANNVSLLDIALSWFIVMSSLLLYQPAKRFFITRVFFDFSDSAQAGTN